MPTINNRFENLTLERLQEIYDLIITPGSIGLAVGVTPITGGAVGRVLFQGAGNVLQESSNLFWDNVNNRLGIGTSTPATTLQIAGTTTTQSIVPVADSTYNLGTTTLRYNLLYARFLSAEANSLDLKGLQIRFNDIAGITRAILNNSNNFLIGTTTDVASSKLTIESTTQGVLIPRMTTTQRNAIASPATGLQIFNTTTSCVEYFDSFWGWMPVNANSQWYASYGIDYFNDSPAGDGVIVAGASGTGAGANTGANVLSLGQGNITFITGTTSTGIIRMVSSTPFTLGNGRIVNEYFLATVQLSTSTERYVNIIGFQDVFGINQIDGAYFLYDEGGITSGSTATPNFQCVTSSNSVRTFTTTSVVNTASVLRKFRIEINDAATQVLFYINNVLVATHTTNIPVGTSRAANWGILVQKQVGTTSIQAVCVDYYLFKQKFVTPR